MAQSIVDVCNSALQKVGATSILSLDDNSKNARQCAVAFDSNRRAELRKHRWNFATKRVQLPPDSDAPAFDFTYQFTLPADCIRILRNKDTDLDWVVEGRKVLTNLGPTLNLRYIADIADVTQWDPAFYDMVCIALAIDICEATTNSTSKRAGLQEDYKEAMQRAKLANAFEQGYDDPVDDTFWTARL